MILIPAFLVRNTLAGLTSRWTIPDLVGVGEPFQHRHHDRYLALQAERRRGPHDVEQVVALRNSIAM